MIYKMFDVQFARKWILKKEDYDFFQSCEFLELSYFESQTHLQIEEPSETMGVLFQHIFRRDNVQIFHVDRANKCQ